VKQTVDIGDEVMDGVNMEDLQIAYHLLRLAQNTKKTDNDLQ